MKTFYLALIFILFSGLSHAKSNKLTYDEYIQQYGTNDTSIAIIELYFDKRDNSGIGQMSFLPLTTAVAAVVPPVGVGLMAISTPLFLNGIRVRHKYSHKKLLSVLNTYHNENRLSDKLEQQVVQILEFQREIENEEMLEKKLTLLKSIKNNETVENKKSIKKYPKLI